MPRAGLVIRVEGKKVWETESRVDRVRVMSARGEIGVAGISEDDEVIDVVVDRAGFLNRRLEDEVAENQERHRKQVEEKAEEDPESERRLVGVGSNPDEDIELRKQDETEDEKETKKSSGTKETDSKETDKKSGSKDSGR